MKFGLPRHLHGLTTTPTVSPAKAGAQEIFGPQPILASPEASWIPASVGMTIRANGPVSKATIKPFSW